MRNMSRSTELIKDQELLDLILNVKVPDKSSGITQIPSLNKFSKEDLVEKLRNISNIRNRMNTLRYARNGCFCPYLEWDIDTVEIFWRDVWNQYKYRNQREIKA